MVGTLRFAHPTLYQTKNAARNWTAFYFQEVQRSLGAILHYNSKNSILVGWIEAIELAQQRRPYQRGRTKFGALGVGEQAGVLVDYRRVDGIGGRAQHAGAHLHGAGPLQVEHALEGGRDRAADRQRAVIAQQHVVLVAEVPLQARAFVVVEGYAFIIVIGEIESDKLCGLVERLQSFHAACHRSAVGRVQMKHTAGVLANLVDCRVNREAGRVDAVGALCELVAVEIDLDEAGSGNFVEHQPVWVDQEMMLRTWPPRRNMRVDQIVPAVMRDEAVAGGKIDALAPLGIRHSGRHFLQARFRW